MNKIKTLVNSIASSSSSLQLHISNNSSTFCRALNSLNNMKKITNDKEQMLFHVK